MERKVDKKEQKIILLSYKEAKMRIAVCKKDEFKQQYIKNLIYEYAKIHRLDIVVDCYSSGEELLRSEIKYSLIFMGYALNGLNGFEVSKKIRFKNCFSSIIFVSQKTDFIIDSFKVTPYSFIIPPISREKFFSLLTEFFAEFGNDYPIWIRNREETVCLNTSEIVYLEADNKRSFIHTEINSFHCNKTMAKVFSVLPQNQFSKINRAFIVNMNYVSGYNSDEVFLKNKEALHISRYYLKSFKEEYRDFQNPIEI